MLAPHFIATSPVDCRKSHDGLAALVELVMIEKPLSGAFIYDPTTPLHLSSVVVVSKDIDLQQSSLF
jgi:hypothetical protein